MDRQSSHSKARGRLEVRARIEQLESREMLTVSADVAVRPCTVMRPSAANGTVAGYSPAQIRSAYGFNNVSGDGAGQTIAIVTAYNDPAIQSDLNVFDQKFGISAPPSFKQVNQTGRSTSALRTDSGWAAETALDVEWSHAIAPKANILLVQANSDTLGDLLTAVDYARNAAGVSVVSMSWGANEFYGETSYDSHFTTPAGHQGVTFVAAAGDDGSWWGPSWPSSSPNVLAVGGTTLSLNGSGGYGGERGWSYGGGGASSFENEPGYQSNAQHTNARTAPDVSYNADPNTGFMVYDSVSYGGYSGWQEVGGTSAGSPQWAALVAIANQGRATAKLGSLDGATGTLPALYAMYNNAGTYGADFHDVATGASSWFLAAHTGYDGVAGLGTPHADFVIQGLIGAGSGSVPVGAVAGPAKHTRPTFRRAIVNDDQPPVVSAPSVTAARTNQVATAVNVAPAVVIAGEKLARSASIASVALETKSVADFVLAHTTAVTGVAGLFSTSLRGALEQIVNATPVASAEAEVVVGVAGDSPVVEGVAGVATAAASKAARIYNFARIDLMTAFTDAWSSLADDHAASVPAVVTAVKKNVPAWMVTALVVGLDAMLAGYWLVNRGNKKRMAKRVAGAR